MIKVDPQDRWSFERPRSTSLLTMAIIALALIVCGAIYYWYVYLQYSNVYRQLGLSDLPSGLAAEPTVEKPIFTSLVMNRAIKTQLFHCQISCSMLAILETQTPF